MSKIISKYFKFVKATQLPAAIDCAIYMLACTYMSIAHARLGSVWLPVAVVVWLVAEFIGVKVAHLKWSIKSAYRMYLYTDIVVSLVIASAIAFMENMFHIAVVIATTVIAIKITQSAYSEAMARFERRNFNIESVHRYSAVLRKRDESWQVIASLIGSALAALLYSILNIDLVVPTVLALLMAGPVLNWWQLHLANKYL